MTTLRHFSFMKCQGDTNENRSLKGFLNIPLEYKQTSPPSIKVPTARLKETKKKEKQLLPPFAPFLSTLLFSK